MQETLVVRPASQPSSSLRRVARPKKQGVPAELAKQMRDAARRRGAAEAKVAEVNEEINRLIDVGVESGASLESIAEALGVTKQRVHQRAHRHT